MVKTSDEPAKDIALKQHYLDRAKALSDPNLAEVFRGPQVTSVICEMVALGVRSEAEVLQAAYGDPDGRDYWDALLSEPVRVFALAYVLSAHIAETIYQLEMAKIAIIRAFRDAAAAGERWFIGDTAPLLVVEDDQTDFEELGRIRVHPRAAVEWLLIKPKKEHLVPQSLRKFLQSGWTPTEAYASTARRPVTQKNAERFVAEYIKGEQAAGRRATQKGVEAAAKKAGMRGGRQYLRTAFHLSPDVEVKRGRPSKAPT